MSATRTTPSEPTAASDRPAPSAGTGPRRSRPARVRASGSTGTTRLVRLALRRDRILLPAWLVSIGALTAGIVGGVSGLYPTEAERAAGAAFGAANFVTRVMNGPANGTDIGALALVESFGILAILVALASAQTVTRHTRLDEETGRAELLGSAAIGRHARLAAALTIALIMNVAIATVVTVALLASGLAAGGSLAAGLALGGIGLVFAGVAAVTAQVFATSRGANGAAGAVLAVAWIARAIGDGAGDIAASGVEVVSAWPSWLSPIGWGQQVRAFNEDNWAILGLFVVLAGLLVVVAVRLTNRRDVGVGMRAARSGPAVAPRGLASPLGLAWRLQRGILVAWAAGLTMMGAAFGAVGESADELVGASDQLQDALAAMAPEGGMLDLYMTFVMRFHGIAVAAYLIQALLRMRNEEASGRLEPVLATATSRLRWLAGHVAIAAGATVGLLALLGTSAAITYGAITGDWATGFEGFLGGALAQAPAAWALGGFVVAAFALLPRRAAVVAWSALGVSFVMGQLGALLELPQPLLNLSPFTHVPAVPAQPWEALPIAILLVMSVAATAVGAVAFRRRDLAISA